jgi:hypothetical protein
LSIVSPELGEELKRLYAELRQAQQCVADAIPTNPPWHMYDDAGRKRLLDAVDRECVITERIREILNE